MRHLIILALWICCSGAFADRDAGGGESSSGNGGPYSQYASDAQKCGEQNQAACTPDKMGGKTMCGRSVAQMLQCMGKTLGKTCEGNCGNGKDFVKCENGQMKDCGYEKVDSIDDPRCKKPGAVLAYATSPTARGQKYGHVEFVCGDSKYCSVYTSDHEKPWPKDPPDSCWFPSGGGK